MQPSYYGAQPPVYAPPGPVMYGPAPPPVPMMMSIKTQDGIKYMTYYLLFSIIMNLISTLIGFSAFFAPAVAIGAACLVSVMALIMFILFIVSFILLWQGKDEHGPEHSKNIGIALTLFVVNLILTFVGMMVVFAMSFELAISGDITALWMVLVGPAVLGIVGALLWGLTLQFIIKQFTPPTEKTKVMLAIVFFILGSVVNMIIAVLIVLSVFSIDFTSAQSAGVGGIITMIGNLFMCHRLSLQFVG